MNGGPLNKNGVCQRRGDFEWRASGQWNSFSTNQVLELETTLEKVPSQIPSSFLDAPWCHGWPVRLWDTGGKKIESKSRNRWKGRLVGRKRALLARARKCVRLNHVRARRRSEPCGRQSNRAAADVSVGGGVRPPPSAGVSLRLAGRPSVWRRLHGERRLCGTWPLDGSRRLSLMKGLPSRVFSSATTDITLSSRVKYTEPLFNKSRRSMSRLLSIGFSLEPGPVAELGLAVDDFIKLSCWRLDRCSHRERERETWRRRGYRNRDRSSARLTPKLTRPSSASQNAPQKRRATRCLDDTAADNYGNPVKSVTVAVTSDTFDNGRPETRPVNASFSLSARCGGSVAGRPRRKTARRGRGVDTARGFRQNHSYRAIVRVSPFCDGHSLRWVSQPGRKRLHSAARNAGPESRWGPSNRPMSACCLSETESANLSVRCLIDRKRRHLEFVELPWLNCLQPR